MLRFLLPSLLTAFLVSGNLRADEAPVHLFILSGQSNMANLDADKCFAPEAARLLAPEKIVLLKVAVGGEPIRFWLPEWDALAQSAGLTQKNEKGPIYYQEIMTKYRALQQQYPKLASITFCWMQGERDAKTGLQEAYAKALRQLVSNLRRDLTRSDMNVVIGRLSDHQPGAAEQKGWDAVRAIQVDFAKQDSHAAWVDTDDLNNQTWKDGTSVNGLHYTDAGYLVFGQRLARQATNLIRGQKPAADGRPE